jgi:hypothetical protein
MEGGSGLDAKHSVFIDETGTSANMARSAEGLHVVSALHLTSLIVI